MHGQRLMQTIRICNLNQEFAFTQGEFPCKAL